MQTFRINVLSSLISMTFLIQVNNLPWLNEPKEAIWSGVVVVVVVVVVIK